LRNSNAHRKCIHTDSREKPGGFTRPGAGAVQCDRVATATGRSGHDNRGTSPVAPGIGCWQADVATQRGINVPTCVNRIGRATARGDGVLVANSALAGNSWTKSDLKRSSRPGRANRVNNVAIGN